MNLRDDAVFDATALVREDKWLAAKLGRPCFVVDGVLLSGLDAEGIQAALGELLSMRSVFVWTRILADAAGTGCVLRPLGFSPVVTAVTMERELERPFPPLGEVRVRAARASDEASVRKIAASAFEYSRFHRDTLIPRKQANCIKEEWAGNFFLGHRGDAMVVAKADGEVVGFALFFCRGDELVLDLIAVHSAYRGYGVGTDMLSSAALELGKFSRMRTVTQAENRAAMGFYRKLHFRSVTVERVYHYHGVTTSHHGEC